MSSTFHVGVTRDFLNQDGEIALGNIGLELLDGHPSVTWEFLPRATDQLEPDDIAAFDGLIVLAPKVTADSLAGNDRLAVLARFGVGYDSVDVAACTDAGVALTITPDGVRRPVASSMLAFVLALGHRLKEKDQLVRESRWAEQKGYFGTGLIGRTLGIIGLGNIGRDFSRIAQPLEMRHLAYDPYASQQAAAAVGAELVELDTLVRESDFVCVCCPLTEETRHLLDASKFALMKPTAYLVNVARGPIVDELALIDALRSGAIRGAALDVFDPEPPLPDNPLLSMNNVLVTPHCVAHTDECFRLTGESAISSILAVAEGRAPDNVVNRAVLETGAFQRKLKGYAQAGDDPA